MLTLQQHSHPDIIPPETFRRVQDELERRKDCHATGGNIFSGKIYCGDCGQIYGSKVWHSNDAYRKVVWRCNAKYGGEKKCGTPTLTETEIKAAFEQMLLKLKDEKAEMIENLNLALESTEEDALEREKAKIERERDAIGELFHKEIEQNARVAQDQDEYQKRAEEMYGEYGRLDAEVKRLEKGIESAKALKRRIAEFIRVFEASGEEFTEDGWCTMVERVTVYTGKMVLTLTTGMEIEV